MSTKKVYILVGTMLALALLCWHGAVQADEATPANPDLPALAPGVSITLLGDEIQNRAPGEQFSVPFEVTNETTDPDDFLVVVLSDLAWPVEIVRTTPYTETPELEIQLPAGLSANLQISMTVPLEGGGPDEVAITAISMSNPAIQDVALFTVFASSDIFLPVVFNWYPPIPYPPVLNPINNPDQEGTYTVTWQAAELANTYNLEEDDNPDFTSPTVVYAGSGTSWTTPAPGRDNGTYYYRVRGFNSFGYGDYSQTQFTTVSSEFIADDSNLTAGQCTTLRWDFTNVKAVYISFAYGFDKRGVAGVGSFTVCPSITTTYEALVVNQDDSVSEYDFTVNVTGTSCGDPYVLRFEPTTYLVNPGERFSIFWEVQCAKAVYYSVNSGTEQPVTGVGSKIDVQIYQDSLFKLRIEYNNRTLSDNTSFTVDVR